MSNAKPWPRTSLAEEAVAPRLRERVLERGERLRVLAAHVDVAALAAGRVRGDRHRLDQRERIALDEHAILERARLGLVGVADEVVRPHRLARHCLPLAPVGKAAPPRPASFESFTSRITPSGPSSSARRSAA